MRDEYSARYYWWWIACFGILWAFFWQVKHIHAWTSAQTDLSDIQFTTGGPQAGTAVYTSDHLWANWRVAPLEIINDPEIEIFEQVLPECHDVSAVNQPRTESSCHTQEQQKYFWGNVPQYIWRTDSYEARLLPDESEAQLPSSPGDILISEVSWAGSYVGEDSRVSDEWIELYNPTEQIWNVRGLQFEGVRSNGAVLTINTDRYIGPYSYFLIGKVSAGPRSNLQYDPDFIYSTLLLSNAQAGIRLLDAEGTFLDSVPEGPWEAGRNDTTEHFRATAQRDIFQPTADWSSWFTCLEGETSLCYQKSIGWKENTVQTLGTPWQASLY